MSRKSLPLIVEPHPEDYNGYPFITLLQYRSQETILCIVDNSTDKLIQAYVLDLCGPSKVNEELIIKLAHKWFSEGCIRPISIEFSRSGFSEETSRIFRTFNVDFTTRVIGPLPKYPMNKIKSLRRRRKRTISLAMLKS